MFAGSDKDPVAIKQFVNSIPNMAPPAMGNSARAICLICNILSLSVVQSGCRKSDTAPSPSSSDPPAVRWFEDITSKCGVHFTNDPGAPSNYFMPQSVGSGCALFDFDNDGRLDLYFIQNGGPNGPPNKLFHQNPDGSFTDVSAGSGLDVAGYGMGVTIGDVNNDGLPDVLLTEYGRIRLLLNLGNGKFRDVSREAGLSDPQWATSAAFFDYDRDGWLDLVVANYVVYDEGHECNANNGARDFCGPQVFANTVARLYHNRGRAASGSPSFEEVTVKCGLAGKTGPGLGVVCADFDGDGWPDILITNDQRPNHLWMNRHDGTFVEEASARGLAYNALGEAEANMGIACGDIDGDGLFDIFITHLTDERNILWAQGPVGLFQDQTAARRLASSHWHGTGFGVAFGDFRNRGTLDLAIANGRVRRSLTSSGTQPGEPFWTPYLERNQLFANDGHGKFRDASDEDQVLCKQPNVARGLASGDLWNDGSVCLVITRIADPASIYRAASSEGHWLLVRAIDPSEGGRDSYGARVTVRAGGRTQVGWVQPASSYLSSSDPRVHFGLGTVSKVNQVVVDWPDGAQEIFPGDDADRFVILRKGAAVAAAARATTVP